MEGGWGTEDNRGGDEHSVKQSGTQTFISHAPPPPHPPPDPSPSLLIRVHARYKECYEGRVRDAKKEQRHKIGRCPSSFPPPPPGLPLCSPHCAWMYTVHNAYSSLHLLYIYRYILSFSLRFNRIYICVCISCHFLYVSSPVCLEVAVLFSS